MQSFYIAVLLACEYLPKHHVFTPTTRYSLAFKNQSKAVIIYDFGFQNPHSIAPASTAVV